MRSKRAKGRPPKKYSRRDPTIRKLVDLLLQVPADERGEVLDEALERHRAELWTLIVGRKPPRGR